ncbi:MAG: alpha/beta fold hydrolase [Halobacteriales archaeon]
MDETTVRTQTLDFDALRAGNGDRLALLLHGFPDDPRGFEPVMERLADAGYTAVAPYMRGYGGTETPPLEASNYSVTALGGDVIALLNALDADDPLVVGHDWGAVALTAVSRLDPSIIGDAVVASVPPDFVEALDRHPSQALRSWYMTFFQIPGLAEEALRANDFALVERLWSTWSPGWDYADRLEEVKETFREGDTVEAALLYYRAFFDDVLSKPVDAMRVRGIDVPTLLVAGRDDGCVTVSAFDDSTRCYDAHVELETVGGAGHFVHAEKPDLFADRVLEFVG